MRRFDHAMVDVELRCQWWDLYGVGVAFHYMGLAELVLALVLALAIEGPNSEWV